MEREREKKQWNKRILWIITVLGFVLTLYLVEGSSWGSMAVAACNDGYGTFDMKTYHTETVERILGSMDADNFGAYYKYYIVDFVFLLFFGTFQCLVMDGLYGKLSFYQNKWCRVLILGVPILRGACDILENILLMYTIASYPQINAGIIETASAATWCKLLCIRIWSALLLLGIVLTIVQRIRLHKK